MREEHARVGGCLRQRQLRRLPSRHAQPQPRKIPRLRLQDRPPARPRRSQRRRCKRKQRVDVLALPRRLLQAADCQRRRCAALSRLRAHAPALAVALAAPCYLGALIDCLQTHASSARQAPTPLPTPALFCSRPFLPALAPSCTVPRAAFAIFSTRGIGACFVTPRFTFPSSAPPTVSPRVSCRSLLKKCSRALSTL